MNCQHCKKVLKKKQRCGKCKSVFYCEKECQVKDWDRHKNTCPGYNAMYPTYDSSVLHMSAFFTDEIEIMGFHGLNYYCAHDKLEMKQNVVALTYKLKGDLHKWVSKKKNIVTEFQCVRGELSKDGDVIARFCSAPGFMRFPGVCKNYKMITDRPQGKFEFQTKYGMDLDMSEQKSTLAIAIGKLTRTKPGVWYDLSFKLCNHGTYIPHRESMHIFDETEVEERELLKIKIIFQPEKEPPPSDMEFREYTFQKKK
jgi:hypothetical protein